MSLTVHLPGDLAAALKAEAARRGQAPDEVAADLLAAQLPRRRARPLACAGVGPSSSGRSAADAGELLAEGFGRPENQAQPRWVPDRGDDRRLSDN